MDSRDLEVCGRDIAVVLMPLCKYAGQVMLIVSLFLEIDQIENCGCFRNRAEFFKNHYVYSYFDACC